jgi:succinoglycan biosynthesis protein ExoA
VLTPFAGIFAVPALAWIALSVGYGILLGARSRSVCAAAAGLAAIAMHAGWSFGFFRGLWELMPRNFAVRVRQAANG